MGLPIRWVGSGGRPSWRARASRPMATGCSSTPFRPLQHWRLPAPGRPDTLMGHAFALALLLCLAAAQGGHAQVIVAQLSVRLGRSAGVLAAAGGGSAPTPAAQAVPFAQF